jgi:hypothetical protein
MWHENQNLIRVLLFLLLYFYDQHEHYSVFKNTFLVNQYIFGYQEDLNIFDAMQYEWKVFLNLFHVEIKYKGELASYFPYSHNSIKPLYKLCI